MAALSLGVAAWWQYPRGTVATEVPLASVPPPAIEVTAAAPREVVVREYPVLAPEDIWPERPPFTDVKVFGPPPPAPWVVSSGPIRRFEYPRFEVSAPVEQLWVTPSNELPTPLEASYRVGWYGDFGQPGQGGNAVLSAHETWNHMHAPFFYLARAEVGDEVSIEMADGRRFTYSVISNVRYELSSIPMDAILWPPSRGAEEWLTLITCGGRIVYDERTGFGEYLDRDVVVARRIR
ncbi:MAG: class F sortase [Dehalococcoidia bacterium]|nr:class F sortase [Dehalococcoidia bacterium]